MILVRSVMVLSGLFFLVVCGVGTIVFVGNSMFTDDAPSGSEVGQDPAATSRLMPTFTAVVLTTASPVAIAMPEATETAPPPAPARVGLGGVAEADGCSLSVISVEDPTREDDTFYDHKPGTRVVAVEIVVGNVGQEPFTVNPLDTHLVDADGFSHKAELASLADHDQIALTEIGAGEKVKGWVGYAVEEGVGLSYVKYECGGWFGEVLEAGVGE